MILSDTIEISDLKRLIWREVGGTWVDGRATGGNNYTLTLAKHNSGYEEPATLYNLEKLLKEIRSMKSLRPAAAVVPMRRNVPLKAPVSRVRPEVHDATTITPGTKDYSQQAMKQRYEQAHLRYYQDNYPSVCKDGHYPGIKYPDTKRTNGLQDLIINYLTWMGHFANRTNNKGTARPKFAPRYNLSSGKVEQIVTGTQYLKSTSKKGMQDIDCNLKHHAHPYGIPWKIEVKNRHTRDKASTEQDAYAVKVQATGGVYSRVVDDVSFFEQYDGLMRV